MSSKRYPLSFKQAMVQEILSGHHRSAVARKYDLSAETLKDWVEQFRSGRLGGEATGADAVSELSRLRLENFQLRQLASQQALEISFLKKHQPLPTSPPDDGSSRKNGAG
jgi:transposase-like protein